MRAIAWFLVWAVAIYFAPAAQSTAAQRPTGDGSTSSFYIPPSPLPSVGPGKLVRKEPLSPQLLLPNASSDDRILYTSTDGVSGHGLIAVSGDLALPKGAAPAGGWPIIAWAHGTTGIADMCAPSWRGRSPRDQAYLSGWLANGFAVVASDYQGLGTPGLHPYMLVRPEAYDVLDAVRAALTAYPGVLANRVIVVGQSQGSAAALGATYYVRTYAPSVNILGTIATGLVATLATPVPGAAQEPVPPYQGGGSVDAAYSMLYLIGLDQSIDPQVDPFTYVTAIGMPLLKAVESACLGDLFKTALADQLTPLNVFTEQRAILIEKENSADAFPGATFSVPVFTGTGLADAEAGTVSQFNLISDFCAAGSTIQWHYYPGLTHNGTVNASFADSLPFARALLATATITSKCKYLVPPGPLQSPTAGVPFNT